MSQDGEALKMTMMNLVDYQDNDHHRDDNDNYKHDKHNDNDEYANDPKARSGAIELVKDNDSDNDKDSDIDKDKNDDNDEENREKITIVTPKYVIKGLNIDDIHNYTHHGFKNQISNKILRNQI